MPRLVLTASADNKLAVSLPDFLGKEAFSAYRSACAQAGFRYSPALKTAVGEPEFAPRLEDLLGSSFSVSLDASARTLAAARLQVLKDKEDTSGAVAGALPHPLRPYQQTGVQYLRTSRGALLHDEMGLGKTVQVLAALEPNARCLVVCPSQVKGSWKAECKFWRPDLTCEVVNGKKNFRLPEEGEVVVANYELLQELDTTGCVVVFDEAHRAKNPKAKRTKLARALGRRADYVWLLTGTPLLNRPLELWNVLQLADLAKRTFGTFESFCKLFRGVRGRYGLEWLPLSQAETNVAAAALASTTLGRRKSVVAKDLPSKSWQERTVEVKAAALKELNAVCDLLDDAKLDLDKLTLEDVASNKPLFDEFSRVRALVAAAKVPALLKLVEEYEENDEQLVVFSAHLAPVEALADREGWGVITGSTSSDERTRLVEAFQRGELKGLAGTKALCEGVTLTSASHLVFVDRFWTPGLNRQAEDRIHRLGQTQPCTYTDLVADHPLDAAVFELLRVKETFVAVVDQAAKLEAPETPSVALRRFLDLHLSDLPQAEPKAKEEAPVRSYDLSEVADFVLGAKVRKPQLLLETKLGNKVVVGVLTERSKTPGHLRVTDSEQYGGTYFGSFDPEGKPSKRLLEAPEDVLECLADFSREEDPFRYGVKTGVCCCCGQVLTNPLSVELGIGPVCRGNWGL